MSLELLELGAEALGPLIGEVVFVGGASVVLWITDPAAPSPRALGSTLGSCVRTLQGFAS
jgi:hypothetical protein